MQFNIYFGFIGNYKPVKYQYSEDYKTEKEAVDEAKMQAIKIFMDSCGTNGVPSFVDIQKESNDLGVPLKILLDDHIWDLTRYYVIPTELDTIPSKKLKKRNYK